MNASPRDPLASLSALSTVLDLANGLRGEKSLLTALFGLELALELGLPEATARTAFFSGLLRHLGCTAWAAEESRFGDDQQLRRALLHGDPERPSHVVRAVASANPGLAQTALGLGRLVGGRRRIEAEWFAEACGAARLLAEGLGLDGEVQRGLDEVFERWDGAGGPRHLAGEALSQAGRIAQVAHVAVLFFLEAGQPLAADALRLQSGGALDPTLAAAASRRLAALEEVAPARIAAAEALLLRAPLPVDAERLARTFGEFSDLQQPDTRGHSIRVAEACESAAIVLGLPEGQRRTLQLAAHLHDLGHTALPARLWLQPRWGEAERARAADHPRLAEELLAAAPLLAEAAPLVGAHHERLDGKGTPRGRPGTTLPQAARLLAAADVWCALQEPRPHRPAHSARVAQGVLEQEVKAGRLDRDCVAALLGGTPGRIRVESGPVGTLTPREREVLERLARGATNKEIAAQLGLSDRTVQHHTIHIYGKLGVATRAAASLVAARAGLV